MKNLLGKISLSSILPSFAGLPTEGVLSLASYGSILSMGSAGSVLSIGSAGSILSICSAGSILSVGSAGSILCFMSAGSVLSALSMGSRLSFLKNRAVCNRPVRNQAVDDDIIIQAPLKRREDQG